MRAYRQICTRLKRGGSFCLLITVVLFIVSIILVTHLAKTLRGMASSDTNIDLEVEKIARLGDAESDFVDIDYDKSKSLSSDYIHASHGMIFARSEKILWNTFDIKGYVLMQMRFDGVLGFPGGVVDMGEEPAQGLNREMAEEIGLEVAKHGFTAGDHVESMLNNDKKLVLHFFTKEVSEEEFYDLERNSLTAEEYGVEVMGIVRVPLYTMDDGLRGFPAFLANQFTGNARHQLLKGLDHCQLLTAEQLKQAVESCGRYLVQSHRKGH